MSKGGDNSVQEFGAEAEASERDEAAAALHNFLDARAQRKWEAACSYLASNMRKSLEGVDTPDERDDLSCAVTLEQLTQPEATSELLAEARQADVGSLRVEGDQAFIIFTRYDDIPYAMPMVCDKGDWKVAALAAGPLQ